MDIITVENVTKVYPLYDKAIDRLKETLSPIKKCYHKDYYALNDISFSVKKGETVGIIGTNGSGKSTILKIITGVLTPTAGKVSVVGKISALLELGAGFNQDYTGMENLYMNGTMMGYTKEEMDTKIPEILAFADIGDFVNQPVKTYSSGMFVRLAFALAINVEPEVLIVDEALAVGDIFFQSKCYKRMNEIKEKGTTILMVTHDMSSIIKYCDRVILLNKGDKVSEGTPGDMVDIYKRILANQFDVEEDIQNEDELKLNNIVENSGSLWKENLGVNSSYEEYGDKRIEIVDFGVFDSKNRISNIIEKNDTFRIRMRVKINDKIATPIFAYTIKDSKGTEISGTNTYLEEINTEMMDVGKEYIVTFEQVASLQGGEYLLSFGCTGYEGDNLSVFHRLYDMTYLTILSNKNTIGYYDIYSNVSIDEI